ncbi:MAG: IPT/TIG domain-containing protein [Ignavibacteriae bacterium]|nr:IPT/TIG domain-containing protein [Ignavibacteriota bacterium]
MSTKLIHRYLAINIFIVIIAIILFSCKDKPNPVQSADSPEIYKITPDSINTGNNLLTITGKNFGIKQYKVNFNGDTSNIFKTWTDTLITLTVPIRALSGNVSVTNSSGTSNGVYLKILNENQVYVISISPINVLPNDTVTVTGIHFGNTQGKVESNKNKEKIVLWTDTLVKFIYSGLSGENIIIYNSFNYFYGFYLKEIRSPQISLIAPSKFSPGMIISIYGQNFDSSRAGSTVEFNDLKATDYLYWGTNMIKVRVPDNVTSGFLTIRKPRISGNKIEYEILTTPVIDNITPQLANIGDKIIIRGKNFGNTSSSVLINWRPSTIVTWSDNLIEALIPDSCTCGDVYVISSDSAFSNPFEYKLSSCASRAEFNKLNRVRIENVGGIIDTTYKIINDTIKIFYYKPGSVSPDDGFNWTIDIYLVLKSGSLNLKHFQVGFSRFTSCSQFTCYNRYLIEGIDIPLNSFSTSKFTYIIDNQYPEKFIRATTESGGIDFDPKQGQYFYITHGVYNLNNMAPIIITFY